MQSNLSSLGYSVNISADRVAEIIAPARRIGKLHGMDFSIHSAYRLLLEVTEIEDKLLGKFYYQNYNEMTRLNEPYWELVFKIEDDAIQFKLTWG